MLSRTRVMSGDNGNVPPRVVHVGTNSLLSLQPALARSRSQRSLFFFDEYIELPLPKVPPFSHC